MSTALIVGTDCQSGNGVKAYLFDSCLSRDGGKLYCEESRVRLLIV